MNPYLTTVKRAPDHNPWIAAACTREDPETFYPDDRDLTGQQLAIDICRNTCDMTAACLSTAMQEERDAISGMRHGIRGGLTARQRNQLELTGTYGPIDAPSPRRRNKPVAECGTDSGYYRHTRTLKEQPCDACRTAHTSANVEREVKKREQVA